jgi:hypothetical protein
MDLKNVIVPPGVHVIGDADHPDFCDAMAMLRGDARLATENEMSPELIVAAQSRPGIISAREIDQLRRRWPLAGVVGLLGSWCEGETRTGRPWPGVERLYWYEFPAWWRQQIALRVAGRCPDWSRPADFGLRISDCGLQSQSAHHPGVVILNVADADTANALAGILHEVGYATAWQRGGWPATRIHGAVAGIWDGGQLNEREQADLFAFCQQLGRGSAPVIALLDFPRRDGVERALEIGTATVLGKPWLNSNLVTTLQTLSTTKKHARAA